MKKSIIATCAVILVSASPATALQFDIFNSTDDSNINSWISARGGQVSVLEDFEDLNAGWYTSLDSGVGTFTAGGQPGGGATSYNANNNPNSSDPYFSIQSRSEPWFGRYNTTTGGEKWLDSGDITKLILTDIDESLTNLFFYLQDPSDVNATTTITATGQTTSFSESFNDEGNGNSFFIGITLDENEFLSALSWETTTNGDGYGLDDFSTVAPVPEPATMLLFGTGLAGLASIRRRKK